MHSPHVCVFFLFHVSFLLGISPGNPGELKQVKAGLVSAGVVAVDAHHSLSPVSGRWAWAACPQCRRRHPAAARCAARTRMTCTPTWRVRFPPPVLTRPRQIIHAEREGPRATGPPRAGTRTGVSVTHSSSSFTLLLKSLCLFRSRSVVINQLMMD